MYVSQGKTSRCGACGLVCGDWRGPWRAIEAEAWGLDRLSKSLFRILYHKRDSTTESGDASQGT